MKRILRLILLLLMLPQAAYAGPERGDWAGLWKIYRTTDQGSTNLYLFVPQSSEPVLWDQSWNPLKLVESRFESEEFYLNWIVKGFDEVLNGKREGDTVRGEWSMVHPQYRLDRDFTSTKVFHRDTWSPLSALDLARNSESLVDLNQYLNENRPAGKDFDAFWQQDFFPDFYTILEEAPSAQEVRSVVESGGFEERTADARREVESILQELRTAQKEFSLPGTMVLLPFGGDSSKTAWVEGRSFFLINAIQLQREMNTGLSRVQLAHRLFSGALEDYLPSFPGAAFDHFREGFPLYLTASLESSPSIEAVLGLTDGQLDKIKNELPRIKGEIQKNKAVSTQARKFISYDLVRSLAATSPLENLLQMPPVTVRKEFQKYLQN